MTLDIDIVRNARSRRMRLSVDAASGRVRLTLPPRASLKRAMAWADEHRGWIEAQRGRLPEARPFAPGATIPVEGEDVAIDWDGARPRTLTLLRHPGLEPGSRLVTDEQRSGMPDQVRHDGVLVCGGPIEGLSVE